MTVVTIIGYLLAAFAGLLVAALVREHRKRLVTLRAAQVAAMQIREAVTRFPDQMFLENPGTAASLSTWLSDAGRCVERRAADAAVNASAKAYKWLLDWLDEQQYLDLTTHNYFEVKGGKFGGRYRIHFPAVPHNVSQLCPCGMTVRKLCFTLKGTFPEGDVVLMQKASLECDEEATCAGIPATDDAYYVPPIANVSIVFPFYETFVGMTDCGHGNCGIDYSGCIFFKDYTGKSFVPIKDCACQMRLLRQQLAALQAQAEDDWTVMPLAREKEGEIAAIEAGQYALWLYWQHQKRGAKAKQTQEPPIEAVNINEGMVEIRRMPIEPDPRNAQLTQFIRDAEGRITGALNPRNPYEWHGPTPEQLEALRRQQAASTAEALRDNMFARACGCLICQRAIREAEDIPIDPNAAFQIDPVAARERILADPRLQEVIAGLERLTIEGDDQA